MLEGVVATVGVVVSVFSGVLLERSISNRAERRRMRRDVLRRLAANRYVLTQRGSFPDSDFWGALNEVVVAFVDDAAVMKALRTFRERLNDNGFKPEHIVPLMRAMAEAAKLPSEHLDEELIEYVFAAPSGETPTA